MLKLNNKGQSLVMLIVIFPVLIFLLVAVVDIGKYISEKENLNSINYLVIDYGIDNINDSNVENKLIDLALLNDKKINNVSVNISNGTLKIILEKNINGTFTSIFDLKILKITSVYTAKYENEKKVIERIKGGDSDGK